jgi:predicted GIY-YIG superfamily endonuclease
MPDYGKSKIYSISAEGVEGVYIGATTQSLSERMTEHKSPGSKCCSKQLIDTGKAVIELIEDYPCNSKEELNARERYWIENIRICLNKMIPGRTSEEYHAAHREQRNAQQREYYKMHREKCRAYYRENREKWNAYQREYRAKKKAASTVDGATPEAANHAISGADGCSGAAGPERHEDSF